jgi:hypothetical protein
MKKIYKTIVELYDLMISSRKDDHYGRVVSTGSLTVDDLIEIAVSRRTDLNAATLKAAYQILNEVALEEVCNSKQVEFGLVHNGLYVDGVFIGEHPAWHDGKHSLHLRAMPTLAVREALKEITVEVRGMASSGMYINTLTDVASGDLNKTLTPGGGINLTGVKIRIVGDEPGVGIHLTELASAQVTEIPPTAILVNDPSKISFIAPANLPAGDYKLSITTQFSTNTTRLKEPRTYVFDYVLACN